MGGKGEVRYPPGTRGPGGKPKVIQGYFPRHLPVLLPWNVLLPYLPRQGTLLSLAQLLPPPGSPLYFAYPCGSGGPPAPPTPIPSLLLGPHHGLALCACPGASNRLTDLTLHLFRLQSLSPAPSHLALPRRQGSPAPTSPWAVPSLGPSAGMAGADRQGAERMATRRIAPLMGAGESVKGGFVESQPWLWAQTFSLPEIVGGSPICLPPP